MQLLFPACCMSGRPNNIEGNNTKQVQIKAELKARAVCEQKYELRGFQCYKQSALDPIAQTTWVSSFYDTGRALWVQQHKLRTINEFRLDSRSAL